MRYLIKITQNDIENGINNAWECPTNLALRRRFTNMKGFAVRRSNILAFTMVGGLVVIKNTRSLERWINDYATDEITTPARFFIESNDPRLK